MVVRFTAGGGNDSGESSADRHDVAPVISFSARRRAKRGDEHGQARGNHPAGSALDADAHLTDARSADDVIASSQAQRHGGVVPFDAADTPVRESTLHGREDDSSLDHRAPITRLAAKRSGDESVPSNDAQTEEPPPSIEDVENAILKKLRRRGLSEAEILAECMALDLTAHQANELLDRLRALGYVDDRVLAEQLRYSSYERKGQSRQVVARQLGARKIPSDIIDEVLDDIGSDDELEAAREVAEKRAAQMTSLDDATMERRLVGFLARRGYPGGIVRTVVGEILRSRRTSVRFR